jgi:hypothetical protein
MEAAAAADRADLDRLRAEKRALEAEAAALREQVRVDYRPRERAGRTCGETVRPHVQRVKPAGSRTHRRDWSHTQTRAYAPQIHTRSRACAHTNTHIHTRMTRKRHAPQLAREAAARDAGAGDDDDALWLGALTANDPFAALPPPVPPPAIRAVPPERADWCVCAAAIAPPGARVGPRLCWLVAGRLCMQRQRARPQAVAGRDGASSGRRGVGRERGGRGEDRVRARARCQSQGRGGGSI